jgi:hypothetical protein
MVVFVGWVDVVRCDGVIRVRSACLNIHGAMDTEGRVGFVLGVGLLRVNEIAMPGFQPFVWVNRRVDIG